MSVMIGAFARPLPEASPSRARPAPETQASGAAEVPFAELLAQLGDQTAPAEVHSFAGTGTLGHERASERDAPASSRLAPGLTSEDEGRLARQPEAVAVETSPASPEHRPDTPHEPGVSVAPDQQAPQPMRGSVVDRGPAVAGAPDVLSAGLKAHPLEAEPWATAHELADRTPRAPGTVPPTRMVCVAVDFTDGALRARAWLPPCSPAERSRLKQAAQDLLAEHGAHDADFRIHETGGPPVRQRRG